MTKTRRILSLIIVFAIMLSVIPCNIFAFAAEPIEDDIPMQEGGYDPTDDLGDIPGQSGNSGASNDLGDLEDEPKNYVATVNGVKYESFDEAFSAAKLIVTEIAEIVLLADVSFGQGDVLTDIVLDLNGHTLTATVANFLWIQGGSLTVKDTSASGDGMIHVPQSGNAILAFYGTFTMESGTIVSQNNVVYTGGSAKVNIKGGTLTSVIDTGNVFYLADANAVTTISGGYINGPSFVWAGKVVVTGGSFSHSSLISYCADGYTAEQVDGRWTVRSVEKVISVFIGKNGYYTLEEALNAAKANDVIEIRVAGNYSLKNNNYAEGAYCLPAGLTIKGTVEGVTVVNGPTISASNITIENVDFINGSNVSIAFRTFGDSVFKNCSLIAPNGTYYSVASGTLLFENCVIKGSASYGLVIFEGNATITVKGCTLAGWNYFGDTNGVLIEDCTFENATYSELVSSEDFKIVNTKFPSNYLISSYYGPLLLEIENCTVDGEKTIVDILDTEMIDAARDVIVDGVSLKVKYAAEVNGVKYETLADAIAAAQTGDTITLLVNVNECVTISGKNVTLDLNGKKVFGDGSDAVAVVGGAVVTIKNGTLETNGKNCGGVWVKNATATLEDCTLISTNVEESCAVYASNGATITIKNCELTAAANGEGENHFALTMMGANITIESGKFTGKHSVSSNGSDDYDDATLTINGGTFDGPIYWPANGKLTINGGTFTAETAIYLKSGSLEINGGTFTGNGEKKDYQYKDSGAIYTGTAIMIENVGRSEYDAVTSAAINGGTFISVNNVAIQSVAENTNVDVVTGFISNGTFSSDVSDLCVYGYKSEANGDGTYGITECDYVAEVNGVKYETLADAIAAAQAGDTITLLSDFTLSKRLVATKDLTIDLNGHTWTSTATSALAVSGCYIKVTDSSDAKNGTVKAGSGTSGNAIQVINNGEFVLENGNVHSANNGIYVNNGTVTISGGTVKGVATSSAALYLQSNATVTITGGNIEAHNGIMLWENISLTISGGTISGTGSTGIQGNGTYDDTAISVSGGNISGRWAAIYHPQGGELNISGSAKLTGYTGVVVKGGTINISGGTISGTGAADTYKPVSSGYIDTGDGLYIEHYDNSTSEENYGTPVVTITGGTFTSVYGKAVASYANTNNSVTALDNFISGGTFTSDVSDLCADGFACVANGDGTYKVAVAYVKVIAGTMVSLKDSVSIKFYFTKSALKGGKDYFLVFSANGVESQVVKLSDCAVDSSYYMYEYKVFAKQMADDISVIIYEGTDTTDRSARYSTEFSTSIRAYAMTLLNKSDSTAALKATLVDMLNYGAASQLQFGYNTGDLANSELTDAHKAFATTTTPSISNDAYNKGTSGYFAGTIATLADNIKLNLFFTNKLLQQRENVQFVIKYTNYRGESVSYTVDGTDAIVDGSYLKLSVPVVASDIRTKISCEIYIDGTLVDTVTHSVESYCYSLIKSGKEIDICESIVKYGDSAKVYFKNQK